ncbi:twin-arginine translocase TatA/TatE family subunit [Streptomyces sp. NPDC048496]|uniref:twin-arginine translocase TatA/TatE family subunit n=1 Tax=Streptomyces sp. NPDC048496 TaxID=3365558 RepID=UPI003710715F
MRSRYAVSVAIRPPGRADPKFGLSELALILLLLLLFLLVVVLGIKELPELTRSAGKAARIFKGDAKALRNDER